MVALSRFIFIQLSPQLLKHGELIIPLPSLMLRLMFLARKPQVEERLAITAGQCCAKWGLEFTVIQFHSIVSLFSESVRAG